MSASRIEFIDASTAKRILVEEMTSFAAEMRKEMIEHCRHFSELNAEMAERVQDLKKCSDDVQALFRELSKVILEIQKVLLENRKTTARIERKGDEFAKNLLEIRRIKTKILEVHGRTMVFLAQKEISELMRNR